MLMRKVKWNGLKVHLEWDTKSGQDNVEHKLESFDPPAPALNDALQELKAHALNLLELPESYGEGMKVTGVSIKHEDERGVGCTITLQKEIDGAPSPVVINTPYLAEIDENYPLPTAIADQLEEVEAAAARYVGGERAQGELFEDAA